ncbi:MAG: hypothetical protein KIT09_34400 [Bryobacteraceae bacterium]|nr:hypothetical protein [Bryobacteraceae bacterium]
MNGQLSSRDQFLRNLRSAVARGKGFAAGKIGICEIHRINYSIIAARVGREHKLLKALESHLIFHSLKQQALFPPDPDFYLRFNETYVEAMRSLDYLGVFPELLDRSLTIVRHFQLPCPLIAYRDQEPDRSLPSREGNCYLPCFRGKKLLFVCSFAELVRQRATREVFEQVWAHTGKRWFYPGSVAAIEFPYGYTASTHARYTTSLELFDEITAAMRQRDFDVALIAAAGLGIPLAAFAKRLGKIGISLGGHLQVLFGIMGRRWRNRQDIGEYRNDAWIDMPERYRPPETDIADGGAYW